MSKTPAVLGIIPARFGSTRFPGKPLAQIHGKALIQHTWENALRCAMLDAVVVATDDQRIFDHVCGFGGDAVMTSKDCVNGTERLIEVVSRHERFSHADIVVNIQGDEPCLDPAITEKTVQALQQDTAAVMSTAAVPWADSHSIEPGTVKCVMDLHGHALYFSRALIPGNHSGQFKKEIPYYKHVGLYVFKKDFLLDYGTLAPTPLQQIEDLEQLKVLEHGYKIKVVVVDHQSIDVNIPEDIKKVEEELCKQNTYS